MKKHNTQLLKDVLEEFIQSEGLENKLLETRVLTAWDNILGMGVAHATRNKYISNRKLFVQLSSSVMRQQLFMLRQEIVEKLNQETGRKVIDELILQ